MIEIDILAASEMTRDLQLDLLRLTHSVWPSGRDPEAAVDAALAASHASPSRTVVLARDGATPVGCATVTRRAMTSAGETFTVACLSGVCVAPDRQGQGIGRVLVRAVFDRVDRGDLPVTLFQTSLPLFYEKLGARQVPDRFLNSHADDPTRRPWWDPHILIYPATAPWPTAHIDLNGPAF